MAIILVVVLAVYLIIDTPFEKRTIKLFESRIVKKIVKLIIIALGFFHGWILMINTSFSTKTVSGVLLYGLFIVYIMAGENSGIEDKTAKIYFKRFTWVTSWLIAMVHIIF